MAFFAPPSPHALGQPGAAEPIRILSLCLMLTGIFAVPGAQLVREFRQDRIFLATVVGFLVANPILIVLALNGGGATAFAWSRVIGQVATGIVFVVSTRRHYLPGWRSKAVGPLLRFGLPLSIANLVNWSLLNADYLILGRLVNAAEVGVYMIAFNVASWSTAVLGSVLNSVVVPVFGRVSHDRGELGRALLSASQLVALLAMPIGAMTLALSTPLVSTVFGTKWEESAPVLAVLSIYGVLYAFSLLYANVLVATGKTLRLLLVQLCWVATLIPAIVFGLRHHGLVGVAWAHVVTIGLVAVPVYAVVVLRSTELRVGSLIRTLARPLLASAIAGGSAWVLASSAAERRGKLLARRHHRGDRLSPTCWFLTGTPSAGPVRPALATAKLASFDHEAGSWHESGEPRHTSRPGCASSPIASPQYRDRSRGASARWLSDQRDRPRADPS